MNRKIIFTIILTLVSASGLFAQEQAAQEFNRGYLECRKAPEAKNGTVILQRNTAPRAPVSAKAAQENLSELQRQARLYRLEGFQAQSMGDSDKAMNFYQKAMILDPGYAVVYNDLGVMCEGKGDLEAAKDFYLRAVSIDPYFSSAYTNLALFSERARDLNSAAYYWNKRIENGIAGEAWTEKAKTRLEDIRLVLSTNVDNLKEEQVIGLLEDVKNQRKNYKKRQLTPSEERFEKAKERHEKKDYAQAIKYALDASQLDPANKEIDIFIDEVRTEALSQ